MKEIVPSVLSADFSKIEAELRAIERAGAKRVHLDIMDGHFVPNITFGPIIVRAIRKLTDLHLETHLMISEPDKYIEQFIKAGSDTIVIQVETDVNIPKELEKIRNLGANAGLVINPPTNFKALEEYLDQIDHLLIMTVNPGFGGQKLMPEVLEKVKKARPYADKYNFPVEIDGGVNLSTIERADKAGVNLFVAGSAVFSDGNPEENFTELEKRIKQ
ncbi:MAG: ribulose-phosphate 3-epimerase [Candidatus Marinimicrobia bacterium]|nr:ribulose-phosphate 3-epimerase [Candidatus Neomarinimicrobiota bacterium]